MLSSAPHTIRFRQACERLGLSESQAAARLGISFLALLHIETVDRELPSCYSMAQVRQFCPVLNISPAELFAVDSRVQPISPEELAELIREHCRAWRLSPSELETVVGHPFARGLDRPARLVDDLNLEALRSLCRELEAD